MEDDSKHQRLHCPDPFGIQFGRCTQKVEVSIFRPESSEVDLAEEDYEVRHGQFAIEILCQVETFESVRLHAQLRTFPIRMQHNCVPTRSEIC